MLGRLDHNDEEQVEQRLLTDGDFFDELELVENDLIDQYVQRRLSEEERAWLEQRLFQNPQQLKKLAFATSLNEAACERAVPKHKVVALETRTQKATTFLQRYWKIAAAVVVVGGLALAVWVLVGRGASDVDRGMLALNDAYKNERLVESRISELNYAPLRQSRGAEPPNVDTLARSHAELLLLEAVRQTGSAASHHALGRLYVSEKSFDRAIQQFHQALKLDPNNATIHSDLAAALLELGKAERRDDEGRAAQTFGTSLESINRALQLNNSSLEALFNRGLLLEQLKLLPAAEDAWRMYLQKDSSSAWAEEAHRHLKILEEQRDKAVENPSDLYREFLRAYASQNRDLAWTAIARSRSRMGNRIVERLETEYLVAGKENRNTDAMQRLEMMKFAGDVEAERVGDFYTRDLASFFARTSPGQRDEIIYARVLSSAALEKYNRSEFDKAISLYLKALAEFKRLNSPEALFTESWLGYCELRNYGLPAVQRFERLAATYKQRGYKSLQAQAIHAQSDAWTDANEFSKVLDLAGEALKMAEAIQDDSTRLRCLQQFVSINLRLGKYNNSLRYGLAALEIAQAFLNEPKLVWTFYHEAALNFQWLRLPIAAVEFESRALELAKQSAWPFIIVRSYTQLGFIYASQGDYQRSISNGKLALAEGEKVHDEKSRLSIVSQAIMRLGHFYRQTGDFTTAIAQYDTALGMFEQLGLGVYLYETHKARFIALVGAGDTAAASKELDKALALFEEYRVKIQEEQNRNSFFDVGQDIYDLAIEFAYHELSDPIKAFDYVERSRARSLLGYLKQSPQVIDHGEGPDLQHASASPVAPFAALKNHLPEQVQLLQYSLGNDKLFLWLISNNIFESRSVPISRRELDAKIASFVKQLARNSVTKETIDTAAELHTILIGPVEHLLDRDKQLYIVPDKTLVQLPFSALWSAADNKFLVERFAIASAPSSNVFMTCTTTAQSKKAVKAELVLSVGNPTFSNKTFPDLPSLPAAEREAQEVASFYQTLPLLGRAAVEDRVKAGMKNADVIHLASHFVADPHSPMLSKLLLANQNEAQSDGFLEVSEIYEMKLTRTRVAVLSACQTGIEKTYDGEGAMSIARSFISAGVPVVVATSWPVESESASELMIKFHSYRRFHGLSTVAALRKAQLEMISGTDKSRNAPSSWASFVVIGGYAEF